MRSISNFWIADTSLRESHRFLSRVQVVEVVSLGVVGIKLQEGMKCKGRSLVRRGRRGRKHSKRG